MFWQKGSLGVVAVEGVEILNVQCSSLPSASDTANGSRIGIIDLGYDPEWTFFFTLYLPIGCIYCVFFFCVCVWLFFFFTFS